MVGEGRGGREGREGSKKWEGKGERWKEGERRGY